MKKRLVLKNKYFIMLTIISIMVCISIVFMASYAFFTTRVETKEFVIHTGELVVKYQKGNDVINLENVYPISDSDGLNTNPHTFIITNAGTMDATYLVRLELDNTIDNLVPLEYVKMSYSINNGSYSNPILLSDLSSNLSFYKSNTLKVNKSDIISIKFWIDLNAPNEIQNKQFKAKIVVDSIQDVDDILNFDVAPTIQLNKDSNGDQDLLINVGTVYNELGVLSVSDDRDNLSIDDVTVVYKKKNSNGTYSVVSNIDTTSPSIYKIVYSITDSFGNTGTKERYVVVKDSSYTYYNNTNDVVDSFENIGTKEAISCLSLGESPRIYYDCTLKNTIQEAIDYRTESAVILTNNITKSSSTKILADKTVSLDLNGKTLNFSGIGFLVYGNLEINDSKETSILNLSSNTGSPAIQLAGSATTTINYINIIDISTEKKNIGIWESSTCTNCNVVVNNASVSTSNISIGNHASSKDSIIVINGGSYSSTNSSAIVNQGINDVIMVNNADVKTTNYAVVNNSTGNSYLIVNDGYFERLTGGGSTIYEQGTTPMVINGGKFVNSGTGYVLQNRTTTVTDGGNIVVNGGEFLTSNGPVAGNSAGKLTINKATLISSSTSNVSAIMNYGDLIINEGAYIEGPFGIGGFLSNNITTLINGGKIIGNIYDAIQTNSGNYNNIITINDGYFEGAGCAIDHNQVSVININGGTFVSNTGDGTIRNVSTGTINITDSKNPIYIINTSDGTTNTNPNSPDITIWWPKSVRNISTGTINITGSNADVCTDVIGSNTKGVCVYAIQRALAMENGTTNINGGTYISRDSYALDSVSGTTTVTGGIFISKNSNSVKENTGTLNFVTSSNSSVYISSQALLWKPAIYHGGTGTINITATQANKCTKNYKDTTSGLCVYAEGDKQFSSNTANGALQNNSSGIVNINGGTYYGGHQGINNGSTGTINIKNAKILSDRSAVLNNKTGTINICSSTLSGSFYDIWNSTGIVNYTSNTIFNSGNNTPVFSGSATGNYTGTCSSN